MRQCVDSIRAHTNEPYELIFVDNASTDGTVPDLGPGSYEAHQECRQ